MNVPESVSLNGIRYRVRTHEGCVVFVNSGECGPCYHRFTFERKCGCWYVAVDSSSGDVMVSHVIEANRLVCEWFGKNHECPRGEYAL